MKIIIENGALLLLRLQLRIIFVIDNRDLGCISFPISLSPLITCHFSTVTIK